MFAFALSLAHFFIFTSPVVSRLIFPDQPLLISIPYGVSPRQACGYANLRPANLTLENVIQYYKLVADSSNVDAAYVQSWMGNNSGWVMTKEGKMIRYSEYRKPVYYSLCNQAGGRGLGEDHNLSQAAFGEPDYEVVEDLAEIIAPNLLRRASPKKRRLAPPSVSVRPGSSLETRATLPFEDSLAGALSSFQAAAKPAATLSLSSLADRYPPVPAPSSLAKLAVRDASIPAPLELASLAIRKAPAAPVAGVVRNTVRDFLAPAAYQYECRMLE